MKLVRFPIRVYHRVYAVSNRGAMGLTPPNGYAALYKSMTVGFKTAEFSYDAYPRINDVVSDLPQPAAGSRRLFVGGELPVLVSQNGINDTTTEDTVPGAPSGKYDGPTNVSFVTSWRNPNSSGFSPEDRISQFQIGTADILKRGACNPSAVVTDYLTVPDWDMGGGVKGAVSARFADVPATLSDLIDQVELAAAKLGVVEVMASDSEYTTETVVADGETQVYVSCPSAIEVQPEGPLHSDGYLYLFAIQVNNEVQLYTRVPPGLSEAADKARQAADGWTKALSNAVAAKSAGQPVTEWPSSTRPPDTASPELENDVKTIYDSWWRSASSLLSSAKSSSGPTEDAAYSAYVAAGGTLSKSAWLAALSAKQAEPASNESFWSMVGSALGYVAGKTGDGIAWLGDKAVDVAKDWGPAGTVGALAAAKGLSAVSSSDIAKWLPWIAGGALAILLLK